MGLVNLIGKFQSVLVETLAPGGGAEKTKGEDTALFEFSSQGSEEIDFGALSDEFAALSESVAEHLNANKKGYEYSNYSNEAQKEMFNLLNNSQLPDELRDELAPLYEKLSETTDDDSRAMVQAQIDALSNKAKQEGLVGEEIDATLIDLSLSALDSAMGTEMQGLYEMLADETSPEKREQIQSQIQMRISEYGAEKSKLQMQKELETSNMPDELKDELAPLYAELSETTDPAQRDRLQAEIAALSAQAKAEGLVGDEIDTDLNNLTIFALRSAKDTEVASLYEELSQTTSYEEKVRINAEIMEREFDYRSQEAEIVLEIQLAESGLPDELKDELTPLYRELSETTDPEQRDKLQAQIAALCSQSKQDGTITDEVDGLLSSLSMTALRSATGVEIRALYEDLANATSDSERARINAEIYRLHTEFNEMFPE